MTTSNRALDLLSVLPGKLDKERVLLSLLNQHLLGGFLGILLLAKADKSGSLCGWPGGDTESHPILGPFPIPVPCTFPHLWVTGWLQAKR